MCFLGMPLYHLKIKPILEQADDSRVDREYEEEVRREKERYRERQVYSHLNYKTDQTLSTEDKLLRYEDEEMAKKIK